ncbi:glycosyltransferase family 2 protein [Methanobrevibacter sp. DSM 116169]|uniref:glycosyltransferase family 2 protein n=1 Tax=Methanobrevibacter sp. DSM 116169 TaxID=3242727 RepID=UPI0038FD03AA
MKVSIITPNFNGLKFLKRYFESLKLEKDIIEEIIIVDNGSNDGSIDFIKEIANLNDFKVKLIENESNLGFAKAVNQGILEAKSEFIYLLNNDIEIEKRAIYNLIEFIKDKEDVFSLSSKMIRYNNRDLIDDAGDEYNLLGWTSKTGLNKNISKFESNREIFSSCAGAALYKKSLLIKLGLFDEEFFAYLEDMDLGLRSQIAGYKNYYIANSIVYHIGSGTSGSQYNEFKVKISARNNVWLVYKNLPIPQKIINILFLFLGFLIKYLFFIKKGYGKLYLSGLKEGLKNRNKIKKTEFKSKNIKNYFKIEWKLIVNTFKLLKR